VKLVAIIFFLIFPKPNYFFYVGSMRYVRRMLLTYLSLGNSTISEKQKIKLHLKNILTKNIKLRRYDFWEFMFYF
jgi:hypothetical protein